jgi:guanylate kinase
MSGPLPFPPDVPMGPLMLALYNPDYARFGPLLSIDPLIWGKQEISHSLSAEKHVVAFLGPSASGKDTILRGLDIPYTQIITHTTRVHRKDPSLKDKYIFVQPEEFDAAEQNGEFIETLPQTAGCYGTTKNEVERALQRENRIVVWRGEETGLPAMWRWLTENHPMVQHHVVFVLPRMPLVDLAVRIIEQRGADEAKGRIQKSVREILSAGSIADFIVLNPPQTEGPRDATRATQNLFTYFLGR